MKVFLIGYMGSGKSKVAEALGKIMDLPVVHTDELVEEAEGKSISEIFKTSGQEHFRDLEKKALHSLAENNNVVVSTGGGLPCYFDNMEYMNAVGVTVYLEANPGLLFHRLSNNKTGRPLIENLNDVELMEQISGQLAVRSPFYKKAQIIINAASVDVKSLSKLIMNMND
ncbi:MAG: AAA family ATPase [Bacteroidia bacterium]|mgnify:CR=1 FL=1|nr:AAA family ATPase [Bacteroidia bacterium]MBP6656763.1 AAA family ATPase [Bacteroidia bacterium]